MTEQSRGPEDGLGSKTRRMSSRRGSSTVRRTRGSAIDELDVVFFVIELEDTDHEGRWPHQRKNVIEGTRMDAPERAKMHREPPFWGS